MNLRKSGLELSSCWSGATKKKGSSKHLMEIVQNISMSGCFFFFEYIFEETIKDDNQCYKIRILFILFLLILFSVHLNQGHKCFDIDSRN